MKNRPPNDGFANTLQAARQADASALTRLWNDNAGEVLGFLLARGTPEPYEVLNDVFLGAFDGIERFEGGASEFRSWLFQIARYKRVDALRRAGRDRSRPWERTSESLIGGDVEQEAVDALEDYELWAVLKVLTPEQRDVVVLRFVFDLSLAQTAAAVERPVGAVKALQHRALARLRKQENRGSPYLIPGPESMTWLI